MTPEFPHVSVPLVGKDGNVFAIIGRVRAALRAAGESRGAAEFLKAADGCGSYDEVLALVQRTVHTT